MNPDRDFQMMRKNERAHFFSPKEQELILKLYEEEREILTAKSNTTSASKLREEAWQRIADKINTVSDSGYKRSWQQVKVKHKNIVQTAKRRRAGVSRNEGGSATPSLTSAEEDVLQHKDSKLRVEVLPGGACIEPLTGSGSSFISVSGHPVLLLPVTKTEPESLSSDETDVSDSHFEGDLNSSSIQERATSTFATSGGRHIEKETDDLRALYCSYLRKEMENRDQQMAFRALKMKKLEKEILLLDKQLM
ncbi:GT1 domain-containing protein [Acanthopagrus latus]|uniref:GT1 domain-containing protein n=1 Tax=Acanthopagrus latus TaxID=8177 RepID=UPI00187CE475|nr:GT1 domain-containing protein [Acanthopagrus latus]